MNSVVKLKVYIIPHPRIKFFAHILILNLKRFM